MALSDQLQRQLDSATRKGKIAKTKKGTVIDDRLVSAVKADESDNLRIIENNTLKIQLAIRREIALALEEIGQRAERYAKLRCPVDTGRLKNSITHAIDTDDDYVVIGTNVSYAPFVENDTHSGGRVRYGAHFLRDAASQHIDEYRKILKKFLDSETV